MAQLVMSPPPPPPPIICCRRPISYGNPSLGTYDGFVLTSHVEDIKKSDDMFQGCVVAMVYVPPEQVPEGVMNLARSHRNQIEHARIFISSSSSEEDTDEFDTKFVDTSTSISPQNSIQQYNSSRIGGVLVPSPSAQASQTAAAILATEKSTRWEESNLVYPQKQHQLAADNSSSLPRTYMVLVVLSSPASAKSFVRDLHQKPYTTLDETQVANIQYVIGLEAEEGNKRLEMKNLLSPILFTNTKQEQSTNLSATMNNTNVTNTFHSSEEQSTTNHNEMSHHDVYNCPVCLDPLDLNNDAPKMLITTVCNHTFHWACLWHCKDSPCPVCRYDHAGLNDTLSQCHICGTTEHNYVCLICGVVSCVDDGHAQHHYEETLHAYALDSETQHVWDFCGQGYVHRLLQNSSDGKLVEVSQQQHNQRLPEAGRLSDSQEGEIVHRKLEGFANQYYRLLQSQLEQQRLYYQGQLDELNRRLQDDKHRKRGNSSSSSFDTLLSALKHERQQLHQRLSTLQDRYRKVSDEVIFLKNLNESLETNKEQMKRQIQEAQRERVESRKLIESSLPSLERKVQALMLQLEQDDNSYSNDSKSTSTASTR